MATKQGKPPYQPRYMDIGVNLADPIFRGIYHGSERHPDDLAAVIDRARQVGCTKLIVTGSDFQSCRDAISLTEKYPGTVYSTVGIHPCSSSIFGILRPQEPDSEAPCAPPRDEPPQQDEPDEGRTRAAVDELQKLLTQSRSEYSGLVAFGEFGLDYDRLHYCSRAVQLHSFAAQLDLVAGMKPGKQLPLFLHSRAAHADFARLLKDRFGPRLERLEKGGVVHSFTGTLEEMKELTDLGLFVGVNGCSLKTAENCDVVKEIPLDSIMLETDGPWCEMRPSHEGWKYLIPPTPAATEESVSLSNDGPQMGVRPEKKQQQQGSKKNQKPVSTVPERFKAVRKEKWEEGAMIKGRNEPCMIERVATAVAGIKGVSIEEVCEAAWKNTTEVFGVAYAAS